MFAKSKWIFFLLIVLLFTLSSCVGSVLQNETTPIADSAVALQMQFLDGSEPGPLYDVSFEVPSDWVGQYQVRNFGNRVTFESAGTGTGSEYLLSIEALSPAQYWRQSGSYPGSYVNIVNKGDTYFIYHLPIDSYFTTSLDDEAFEAFSAQVPDVIASFDADAN